MQRTWEYVVIAFVKPTVIEPVFALWYVCIRFKCVPSNIRHDDVERWSTTQVKYVSKLNEMVNRSGDDWNKLSHWCVEQDLTELQVIEMNCFFKNSKLLYCFIQHINSTIIHWTRQIKSQWVERQSIVGFDSAKLNRCRFSWCTTFDCTNSKTSFALIRWKKN